MPHSLVEGRHCFGVALAGGDTHLISLLSDARRAARLGDPHRSEAAPYLRMFTARAAASSTVTAETADSISIRSFMRRVSGIASVGLKAIAFVNAI
jgi:hypothetical protein